MPMIPERPMSDQPRFDGSALVAAKEAWGDAASAPGPLEVKGWEPITLWDFPNDRAVRIENVGRFLRIDPGYIDRGVSSDGFVPFSGSSAVLIPHGQVIDFVKAILASSDPEVLFPWEDPCDEIDPRFAFGRTLEGRSEPIAYLTQSSDSVWGWAEAKGRGADGRIPLTDSGKVRVLKVDPS